ncbi:MAG TPA: hypothetical protein VG757_10760 [Devosia sp.]|nr:hypothetical protein [Devosia sp.]
MRLIGLALVLLGLILFVLPTYAHLAPFLRRTEPGDLRLWGAMLLGVGAIAISLGSRRS